MAFEFIKTFLENIQEEQRQKEKKIQEYVQSIPDEKIRQVPFTPLKKGGTNIKSHDMKMDQFGNIVFKVKPFFPLLFLAMFSVPLIMALVETVGNASHFTPGIIFSSIAKIIFGGIFLLPAGLVVYFIFRNYIFDFQNGYFYDTKYKNEIFQLNGNPKYEDKIVSLNEIYALQIISERVKGNKTSYMSYELNMILKNGKRVNIIDHGNLEEIRNNAQELKNKLGVNVYDLTLFINND